ncbi:MAG: hypothetical protein WB249_05430 [Candidatus Sulfotelmatobacter sp.]
MFSDLVKRQNALLQQRNEIGREVMKLRQLIIATFPLLPADKQEMFQAEIEALEEQTGGLLSAIQLVFSAHKGEWLTPAKVRDYLIAMGFDMTQYRANPLASIATTLRRMVPDQLESQTVGEQVMYRRRITLLDRMGQAPIDPNLLPEQIRGVVHPVDHLKRKPGQAPIPPASTREKAEEERKKLFPQQLGYPDPLNQRGKK